MNPLPPNPYRKVRSMRARRFRPVFDTLDGRMLLSVCLGATPVSASAPADTTVPLSGYDGMPCDDTNPAEGFTWFGPGAPPEDPYDVWMPPVDLSGNMS